MGVCGPENPCADCAPMYERAARRVRPRRPYLYPALRGVDRLPVPRTSRRAKARLRSVRRHRRS